MGSSFEISYSGIVEEKYTPEKHYEMLMDVYRQAIEGKTRAMG